MSSWATLVIEAWQAGADYTPDGVRITSELVEEALAACDVYARQAQAEERAAVDALKAAHPMATKPIGRPKDQRKWAAVEYAKQLVADGWDKDPAAMEAAQRHNASFRSVRDELKGWDPA